MCWNFVFSLLYWGGFGNALDDSTRIDRRILLGIMSSVQDVDRRDIMRQTWITEAHSEAISVTARFVVAGRGHDAASLAKLSAENATHGDLVLLPCEENQHKGKTLWWFNYVHNTESQRYQYAVKMDQDVYVWPLELQEHLAGFAARSFYGGKMENVYRRNFRTDRFVFANGGFVVLSMDLVAKVATVAEKASIRMGQQENGFLNEDIGEDPEDKFPLQGNEDVVLGRLFKKEWELGKLNFNVGDFPWSTASTTPMDSKDFASRTCPWRHAKDLKTIDGYRMQWDARVKRTCRCNCLDDSPTANKNTPEGKRTKQRQDSWSERIKGEGQEF